METRAKCTKYWGNCKTNSSTLEHVAKLRPEEEHRAPGTELYSSKACSLYPCYVFCIQLLLPYVLGRSANKPTQLYFHFWPRLSHGDWTYPPMWNSLKTRYPRYGAQTVKDSNPWEQENEGWVIGLPQCHGYQEGPPRWHPVISLSWTDRAARPGKTK